MYKVATPFPGKPLGPHKAYCYFTNSFVIFVPFVVKNDKPQLDNNRWNRE